MATPLTKPAAPQSLNWNTDKKQTVPYDADKLNATEVNALPGVIGNHQANLNYLLAQLQPVAVQAFNPQQPDPGYYGPGPDGTGASLVTYARNSVTDFYTAKVRMTRALFPGGIPAPASGGAADGYWQLASPPTPQFQGYERLTLAQARALQNEEEVVPGRAYRILSPSQGAGIITSGLFNGTDFHPRALREEGDGLYTPGSYEVATDLFISSQSDALGQPVFARTNSGLVGYPSLDAALANFENRIELNQKTNYVTANAQLSGTIYGNGNEIIVMAGKTLTVIADADAPLVLHDVRIAAPGGGISTFAGDDGFFTLYGRSQLVGYKFKAGEEAHLFGESRASNNFGGGTIYLYDKATALQGENAGVTITDRKPGAAVPAPGSGVAVRSSTVLTFEADAEYNELFSGTYTVDTSTKVTGKVVRAFLAPSATEPVLGSEFQKATARVFTPGSAHIYSFCVGPNGKIQYYITVL